MQKRIRIKDIAEKAGVSTGTVDRVLHNRGNVSQQAKEKVMAVMDELDYEPNIIASMLAYNRTFRIVSLLPDYETDLYWAQPKLGIERALNAVSHYGISLEAHYFDLFEAQGFVEKSIEILNNPPDAILFAPIFLKESIHLLQECEKKKIPVALLNTNIDQKALCYVGQDSYQSGVLAGKLLDFGLRNSEAALLLNLGKETANAQHMIDKEKGFRDYFKKNEKKDIQILKGEFSDYQDQDRLRDFLMEYFERHPEISGVFVVNSRAFVVINCLKEKKLRDLKIVGFDLIDPNLDYLYKNKISFLINQNPVQQGYLGIMNIINHLVFKKEVERIQYLPLDIVVTENVEYYLKRELEFQVVI